MLRLISVSLFLNVVLPVVECSACSISSGRKRIEQEKLQAKLNASDDPDLRREFLRWAKTSEGTYKDLRTLLSSLQEILWNDADWTPKTISDLMMSSQRVKKAYR